MAFDFPNNPTIGQVYTPAEGGPGWTWNGTYWSSVTTTLSDDAPSDGNAYGRKDAAWVQVIEYGTITALDLLNQIKTVDGAGSGLDADMLDGQDSAYYAVASVVNAELANRVAKTGDTMSGPLLITTAEVDAEFTLNKLATAAFNYIRGRFNNVMRWRLVLGNNAPEGGGSVGTDFAIQRFDNSGALIDEPISIPRGTGIVAMPNGITVAGGAQVLSDAPSNANAYVRQGAAWVIGYTKAAVDALLTLFAPLASPAFTGNPTRPSLLPTDNSTAIATTEFVKVQGYVPDAVSDGITYGRRNGAWAATAAGLAEAPTDGAIYGRRNSAWVVADVPVFQCYFERVSTTIVRLSRQDGLKLWINGFNETIPSAGVDLSAAALTLAGGIGGNGAFYVYAYMSAGVMTLEASTTAYTVHTNGVKVKTGDATRTYIGMALLISNGTWHSPNQATLSNFNRRPKEIRGTITTGSTTSTSLTELHSSMRTPFVWTAGHEVDIGFRVRTLTNTTAAQDCWADLRVNPSGVSVVSGTMGIFGGRLNSAGNASYPLAYRFSANNNNCLSEGYNVTMIYGQVSGGTGTWLLAEPVVHIWG